MARLLQILFWSVIAAAFVGPGTVTTCASAGARHRHALLWAIAFSTIACLVLQEAASRVTIVSGRTLGQALRERFHGGLRGLLLLLLVLGAIVVGCAAYQAGNLVGATAGASLGLDLPPAAVALAAGGVAAILLWFARTRTVAYLMGLIVAMMGVSFLVTAALLAPPFAEVARGLAVPVVPEDAGLLVVGLIGTTVVPYNLFLGSGLAKGQALGEMRFGLSISILFGGLISMAILVVGGSLSGEFGFEALAAMLGERLGGWAPRAFALGLFCAGFSSAITAPLAAAMTARSLFERDGDSRWTERSWRYRATWIAVMATGVGFALAAVRPVEVIVVAQALNGVLLPFVAVFLMLVVNDPGLMGGRGLNRWPANLLTAVVVATTLVLGLSNVLKAARPALDLPALTGRTLWVGAVALAVLLAVPVARALVRQRSRERAAR